MVSTFALIATAAICLFAGIGIGMLIIRVLGASGNAGELEAKFNTLESEYSQYQQNVAQHFVDTSRLIAETQQRQRDLREHLVSGALHLTSAEVSRSILAQADDDQPLEDSALLENIDPSDLNPPKDWAPKTPGYGGVLSEEFGLKEEDDKEESIETRTATTPPKE